MGAAFNLDDFDFRCGNCGRVTQGGALCPECAQAAREVEQAKAQRRIELRRIKRMLGYAGAGAILLIAFVSVWIAIGRSSSRATSSSAVLEQSPAQASADVVDPSRTTATTPPLQESTHVAVARKTPMTASPRQVSIPLTTSPQADAVIADVAPEASAPIPTPVEPTPAKRRRRELPPVEDDEKPEGTEQALAAPSEARLSRAEQLKQSAQKALLAHRLKDAVDDLENAVLFDRRDKVANLNLASLLCQSKNPIRAAKLMIQFMRVAGPDEDMQNALGTAISLVDCSKWNNAYDDVCRDFATFEAKLNARDATKKR
jgi:hypothetical protein